MGKYKGKIEKNDYLNKKVIYCRIKHLEPEKMEFKAGQYFMIIIDKRTKRAYSIGSTPNHQDYVETYVDITPGGPGSQFYMNAKVGDEVEYIGPIGRFVYEEGESPLLFIATGTGLVPFLSMIEHALTNGSKRKMNLLLGFRYKSGVFAEEKLKDLSKKYDNFKFRICLSKDQGEGYSSGRVTPYLEETVQELGEGLEAFICGGKEVVESIEQDLFDLGVSKEQIRYEKYY